VKILKSSRYHVALSLTCLLLMVSGSALAGSPAHSAGCKTEHFLITHLAGPYEAATGQTILPGSTGNKKAIHLFAEGKLDFAYTCKPHEVLARKFQIDPPAAADWASVIIARDPIIVVAHPSDGVENLTLAQLKALFAGDITNWSDVGGSDLAVTTSYLDETVESGVVTVFKETTIGAGGNLDPSAKTLPSPKQVGYYTKSTPGAVSFMALNSYKPEFGQIISVDGVAPDKELIAQGEYPLSVTYYVVYDRNKADVATSFLGFVGSSEGQALINEVMVAIPLPGATIQ